MSGRKRHTVPHKHLYNYHVNQKLKDSVQGDENTRDLVRSFCFGFRCQIIISSDSGMLNTERMRK